MLNTIRRRKRTVSVGPQSEADARELIARREGTRRSARVGGGESHGQAGGHRENEDEERDRNMFSQLEPPRVRYDVEVITKLVVYAGIAWLAVEGNPLLFEQLGIS